MKLFNEIGGCAILFEGKEGNCGTGFQRELVNIFPFMLSVCSFSAVYSIYIFGTLLLARQWAKFPDKFIIYSRDLSIATVRCQALGQVP